MKIAYVVPTTNKDRDTMHCLGYTFKPFTPIEVPEDVAALLLEMKTQPCRCHGKQPQNMFAKF